MKETKISRFKNIKSIHPDTTTILSWLKDDSLSDVVFRIRQIEDKTERSKLKAILPAVTLSGLFSKRKIDNLITHSGYLCIDIDADDNPTITDFVELRNQLRNIVNISYVGLSVSGRGVFGLIPIKFTEKHKEHFEALKVAFSKLGIVLDKACGDITRLRIYSYDKDAYFNDNAVIFEETLDFGNKPKIIKDNKNFNPVFQLDKINSDSKLKKKVFDVIMKMLEKEIDMTETYNQWFAIGSALSNEFREDGKELFHLVSQNHKEYCPSKTNAQYSECLKNPKHTIRTFFYFAIKYGLE